MEEGEYELTGGDIKLALEFESYYGLTQKKRIVIEPVQSKDENDIKIGKK